MREQKTAVRWLALLLLGLVATSVAAYDPPICTYCTNEPNVVAGSTPQLHASVKWCCISGSPACDNPTLACQSDFKTMLWRRHERASDCIWIPQCKITLRSGGAIQKSDYEQITDTDTSIGTAGDVVITSGTELLDTWDECDVEWAAQPKGILAVSADQLIDTAGVGVARGVAYQGSIAYPYMMVADLDIFCQFNERSLAHEAGHVLDLGHTGVSGELMQTGGSGATLPIGQCTTSRAYLAANTILDPPAGGEELPNLVDFVFDARGDGDQRAAYADIGKIVVVDDTASGGDFALYVATGGILVEDQAATYWVSLDTDNDPGTGGHPTDIIPGNPIGGVDFLAQVEVLANGNVVATLLEPGPLGSYIPVPIPPNEISAKVKDIDLVICDPTPDYDGPMEIPAFTEIEFRVDSAGLDVLGLPGGGDLFPAGLMLQGAIAAPSELIDFAPDNGGVVHMPPIIFPTIEMAETVQPEELVPVTVDDMPPNQSVTMFFGNFELDVNANTDQAGHAEFDLIVPSDAVLGRTNVSAGVDDPDNAMTADTIVDVIAIGPSLSLAGTCPGLVTVTATGGTPNGAAAIIFSPVQGSDPIPAGPCIGTPTGLSSPQLLTVLTLDANGELVVVRTAPAGVCGISLQVVDVGTCSLSNVEVVP